MKPKKTYPDLSLNELKRLIKEANSLSSRCREQFIKNVKSHLKNDDGAKARGRILFDPDCTFQVERDLKHGCDIVCDVVAVGIDSEGKIVFDLEGECHSEKDVHLHEDVCYGAYVEDWPWALKVLLETFEDPYEPEDEEEDGDDNNDNQ